MSFFKLSSIMLRPRRLRFKGSLEHGDSLSDTGVSQAPLSSFEPPTHVALLDAERLVTIEHLLIIYS